MKKHKASLGDAMMADTGKAGDDHFGVLTPGLEAQPARRGVLVRVSPELRRELKRTAIARDTTVQNLMLEAIAIVLRSTTDTTTEP
ncbi:MULTISPECIES: ribbon-helix-helix domain-containing protein [Bradyrhizobium]|uniref:Antitoxin-like ribbon-helix-helix domain-containing protein n=1 Tax=Bradyrhizobium vignae TaxID=1549949 RepID=A0A2U3Q6N1_9BRAD|nr:ribbon-helix-helix domain-containing protein [Bradyrhizobium vignae]MBP0115397.1 hypothetical protein [Bradyrhizobium vignae]SPP97095.1 protein of unknown function [Bradyrhizobium vignae]